jgi:hypothetical protein
MGHACIHDQYPGPDKEHPVIAVIAVVAIIAAMLLIAWARFEVHGTEDIEAALADPLNEQPVVLRPDTKSDGEREVDAAVTSSRFATGFSP